MANQKVIVTKAGDTWDVLAKDLYGDERYMTDLIKANIHFRNTVFFSSGVVLVVPDIDTSERAAEANLPPWKRGR